MKGCSRRTWLGCAVALALGASVAHAGTGGTITFVGAIVAPTCSFGGAMEAASGSANGGCGVAPEHPSAPTSMYRQDVVPLEGALNSQDRLLNYFAGYAGTANARFMTRTYE